MLAFDDDAEERYAAELDDLRVPPGNGLEALKGDRSGQYSIRINNPSGMLAAYESRK